MCKFASVLYRESINLRDAHEKVRLPCISHSPFHCPHKRFQMTDLPPGLAARRAKVNASVVSASSSHPDQDLKSERRSHSRDASPERAIPPAPTGPPVDPEQWQLQEGTEYGAIWSTRLGKFVSTEALPIVHKKPMKFTLVQFYPRVLGFLKVKPKNVSKIVEVLELRDPRLPEAEIDKEGYPIPPTPTVHSVLDLSRSNLRSDPKWRHKKNKKQSASPDQGVQNDGSESDKEEEDARREEDSLEQFAGKLRSSHAEMKTEGKEWTVKLEVNDHPINSSKKAISIVSVSITLHPYDKKKEKKQQKALEWETRKLQKATAIPSSIFYRQVKELEGRPRTRRSRFTEAEQAFYLKLHDAASDDESDVGEEPGDEMEEDDVE